MPCQEGPHFTELEFVVECSGREPDLACRGPLVHVGIVPAYVTLLDEVVRETPLHEVLWGSPCEQNPSGFHCCAAHWLDIAYLVGRRGIQGQGMQWLKLSHSIVDAITSMMEWDRKEIANLQRWRELGAPANS